MSTFAVSLLALALFIVAPTARAQPSATRIRASSESLHDHLQLHIGFGRIELEDGLNGRSTRFGLGLDIGRALALSLDVEMLELDNSRVDQRVGVETRYTFLAWRSLRQYASLRAFLSHRDGSGAPPGTASLGVGAQLAMGVEIDLFGPVTGFAELGFGATGWNDPSQADRWEHFAGIMFGLRGTF